MNANKVIERIDALRPNPYSEEQKLEWINNLEEMVQRLVIQSQEIKTLSYPDDMDKELLITAPFDNLYGLYLETMIDYYNREYGNYNNSALMFETRFTEYKKSYIRGNSVSRIPDGYLKPLGSKTITENGEGIDVKEYASVNVRISRPEATAEERTVTPSKSTQMITPIRADFLSSVMVNPIPDEYLIPSGELMISNNGKYDVSDKSTVKVSILTPEMIPEVRTVTPNKSRIDVYPSTGDYLSMVTVNPIPDEYVIPSGEVTLTTNGEHSVSGKAKAIVNVPIPDGYLKPTGTLEITENGDYEAGEYASVNVNVNGTPNLQKATATITENGTYSIKNEMGFDGLSEVNITVNVANTEIEEYDGSILNHFTIDGVEYKSVEGATWAEWVESEYSPVGSRINESKKVIVNNFMVVDQSSYERIITGYAYTTEPIVM